MKINIIEVALQNAESFLHAKEFQNAYQAMTEKYIRMHNKGIFVNFSTNAKDTKALFQTLAHRYGFDLPKTTYLPFSRKRLLKVADIEQKHSRRIAEIKIQNHKWSKVKKSHHDFMESLGTENVSTDHQHAFEVILISKEKQLTGELQKINRYQKLARKFSTPTHLPEQALRATEREVFKMVLKHYFESIQNLCKDMFQHQALYVKYSQKEWVGFWEEKRKKEWQLTANELAMETIQQYWNKFSLVILDGKFRFSIARHSLDTRYRYPSDELKMEKNSRKKLVLFYQQHPDFAAWLHLYREFLDQFGESDSHVRVIHKSIFARFAENVLCEYEDIVQEIQVEEKENLIKSSTQTLPSVVDLFPMIQFDKEQKKNVGLSLVLREDYLEEVYTCISNEKYELFLEKEIQKESLFSTI